jgi:putative colanic acid biosysnthesis UDP-glucose lipid carrier transferase
MNAAQDVRFRLLHSSPTPAVLVSTAIHSVVVACTLLASLLWFDERVEGSYLILALLVFAMGFPAGLDIEFASGRELIRVITARWLIAVGLLLLLGWATRTLHVFDERVVLSWVLATPPALVAAHRLVPVIIARVLATCGAQRTAIIAGANHMGCQLGERIRSNPLLGIRLVGYFDDRSAARVGPLEGGELLGSLSQLADFVRAHRIDVIYSTMPTWSQPRIRRLLDDLHDTTASLYFVPDIPLFDLIQARVDTVGGIPVLAVCESPYCGNNALVKRGSDLVLATLMLILAAPLSLLIAIGVKWSSPGPVLFRQRRYGMDGREIIVYKFRTMTCMEDGSVVAQARRHDPRTTCFGAFLRRNSLDELPQLLNVIQGRMSIVGPRPHAVAHNEMYRKLIPGYMIRHKVRPGITGLAQVRGLRGPTDTIEKMTARIECDLEYLRSWSLLLDLEIILKTIGVLIHRRNAF